MITPKTIVPFPSQVDCDASAKKETPPGAVVWFTGLSGAGKSTLAIGLKSRLQGEGIATSILDGDHLRQGLCRDLGFSAQDRTENIRRAGEVAKLFAEAGLVVLCALISPFRADREYVRTLCLRANIPFIEIFVDAPLSVCEERDPRGLYAKARRGELPDFTGIDSPYEVPHHPELHLSTERHSSEESSEQLYCFVVATLSMLGTRS
ncbi:MAG: adenylyl-sulfate kinase [Chthoniobacterales bacterium]